MTIQDLMPFLYNIRKEALKGYYSDEDTWIDGYTQAIDDILERIENEEEVR